jgi:uncharacterized cupredoxin-like copper-binding protein
VIYSKQCPVRGIIVSEDGFKARLVVDSLRLGYIHEIVAEGVRAQNGKALLHNAGYYTLNAFPDGDKLNIAFSPPPKHAHATMASSSENKTPTANKKTAVKRNVKSVSKRVTTRNASWGKSDYVITMGTKPGLKFSLEQFQVKAGSKVEIVFNNNDDMLHNFVLVLQGTAIEVGEMAMKLGLEGQEKHYIPESPSVLYHTNILQPRSSETIYFVAPDKPGDYTFVCTIPGHFYSMQGTMKVVR